MCVPTSLLTYTEDAMEAPDEIKRMVKENISAKVDVQLQHGPGIWLVSKSSKAKYVRARDVDKVFETDSLDEFNKLMDECDYNRQAVVAFITNLGDAGDEQVIGIFDLY